MQWPGRGLRVFQTREFAKLARKASIGELDLLDAVDRAGRGLVDASIGSFLIKQRIGRSKQGRSGGFRSIIVFKFGELAVFLHLFAKNRKSNLTTHEEATYRDAARLFASLNIQSIEELLAQDEWLEITHENLPK